MKFCILHLSDLHFLSDSEKNPILSRLEQIAAAMDSAVKNPTVCSVVVSGDITFSGRKEEYELARKFVTIQA